MQVDSLVVPRRAVKSTWSKIEPALEIYRRKSPHPLATNEELLRDWTEPGGDELFVFGIEGEFAGFITFRVQQLEGMEIWGTISILFLEEKFQWNGVLEEVGRQLEEVLRLRGCEVMNYMTARKGFKKLAPRLGFRPRITEWMKEL